MPPDPVELSLIYNLLQICPGFATHQKKLRVRKFGALLLKKFVDTFRQIMQLMKKVSNRVEKTRNCPNACRYQKVSSGALLNQQFSHGTGVETWTKITDAKKGVTEKV